MTCYFPPQKVVEGKLLDMLYIRMEPVQMTMIYSVLADQFGLSRYERRGDHGDPKGSAWEYLVRQARKDLANRNWIQSPQIGQWELTESGRDEARSWEQVSSGDRAIDTAER